MRSGAAAGVEVVAPTTATTKQTTARLERRVRGWRRGVGSVTWRLNCESDGTKPPRLSLSGRRGWARRSRRRRRGRRRDEHIGEVEAQWSQVTRLLAALEQAVAVMTGRLGGTRR